MMPFEASSHQLMPKLATYMFKEIQCRGNVLYSLLGYILMSGIANRCLFQERFHLFKLLTKTFIIACSFQFQC